MGRHIQQPLKPATGPPAPFSRSPTSQSTPRSCLHRPPGPRNPHFSHVRQRLHAHDVRDVCSLSSLSLLYVAFTRRNQRVRPFHLSDCGGDATRVGIEEPARSYRVAPQRYCLVWSNNAFTMPKCHTQRFVHISAQVLHCRDKEQGF